MECPNSSSFSPIVFKRLRVWNLIVFSCLSWHCIICLVRVNVIMVIGTISLGSVCIYFLCVHFDPKSPLMLTLSVVGFFLHYFPSLCLLILVLALLSFLVFFLFWLSAPACCLFEISGVDCLDFFLARYFLISAAFFSLNSFSTLWLLFLASSHAFLSGQLFSHSVLFFQVIVFCWFLPDIVSVLFYPVVRFTPLVWRCLLFHIFRSSLHGQFLKENLTWNWYVICDVVSVMLFNQYSSQSCCLYLCLCCQHINAYLCWIFQKVTDTNRVYDLPFLFFALNLKIY